MSGGPALLLRLDAARLRGSVRRPRAGVLAGVLLPLAVLAAGVWVAGPRVHPRVDDAEQAVLLGLLVGGGTGFVSHPLLLRPADDGFLRRLGIPAGALLAHRALRLLAASLGIVVLLLLAFAADGAGLARPLVVGAAAALGACGAALRFLARAALAVAGERPGITAGLLGPDMELVRAAPLVYAPLAPLLAGALAAGYVGAAPGVPVLRLLAVAAASAAVGALGARPFARALPRFAPRANEMAFERPPAAGETGLVLDRGVARLLPRRVRAARARDAAVLGRRFRWVGRIAWPVAAGGVVALVRWGDAAAVRSWVAAAGALALAAQGGALVALGRSERGVRWSDRSLGVGWGTRLLGRWAAGLAPALWLTVPLALAWGAHGSGSPGWGWLGAALAVSAAAASVSAAAAGR